MSTDSEPLYKSPRLRGVILLFVCAISLLQCVTNDMSDVDTSSSIEGRYSKVFRGRWWNYYDRGRFYLNHGDYVRAENDLLTALSKRDRDQRWARTYGLHLVEEYYPNRELGICYYFQGKFDDAELLLHKSLEDSFSDRGEYYRRRILLRRIRESGGDTNPPQFIISQNLVGKTTGSIRVQIEGEAIDDNWVTEVRINGEIYDIRQTEARVKVSHPVTLSPGENSVTIQVVDLAGNTNIEGATVSLLADHDGPVVAFQEEPPALGLVNGEVFDTSDVSSLTIAGLPVQLIEIGVGHYSFAHRNDEHGASAHEFVAIDALGNRTEGRILADRESEAKVRIALRPSANPRESFAPILGAASDLSSVSVNFEGIENNQPFYSSEVVVGLNISSVRSPIRDVGLNGKLLDILPGKKRLQVSRRLDLGKNPRGHDVRDVEIIATAITSANERKDRVIRVKRVTPPYEGEESRLKVAIGRLRFLRTSDIESWLQTYIEKELAVKLLMNNPDERFHWVNRDPEFLKRALFEQKISVELGREEHALRARNFTSAEALVYIDAEADRESLTTNIYVVSTEHSGRTLATAQIVDRLTRGDEPDDYIELCAVRLAQSLPRIFGKPRATDWSTNRLAVNPEFPLDSFYDDVYNVQDRKCAIYQSRTDRPDFFNLVAQGFVRDVLPRDNYFVTNYTLEGELGLSAESETIVVLK